MYVPYILIYYFKYIDTYLQIIFFINSESNIDNNIG
jgi:hypothetical protein